MARVDLEMLLAVSQKTNNTAAVVCKLDSPSGQEKLQDRMPEVEKARNLRSHVTKHGEVNYGGAKDMCSPPISSPTMLGAIEHTR